MKQPNLESRIAYAEHESARPSVVTIPGTKRKLTMREIHPGTIKKVTQIWIERDMAAAKITSGPEVLKDLAKEPYFSFKEAAILYLNNDLKLRFIYPFLWRIWAFRYTESQMLPIIAEGKKKLPRMAHYKIMAYSLDMRTDMMKMTKAEVEQYRAELLSEAKQPLYRTSLQTAFPSGVLAVGKSTTVIIGFSPCRRWKSCRPTSRIRYSTIATGRKAGAGKAAKGASRSPSQVMWPSSSSRRRTKGNLPESKPRPRATNRSRRTNFLDS